MPRARSTHALPPSPIHLGSPPTSRLWASSAAETRRVFAASRLDMWLRRFAWHHLLYSCRRAAQLHSKVLRGEPCHASAYPSGAVRSLQRCQPPSSVSPPYGIFGPRQSAWICWHCDDPHLMPNASRPTSGSRSSTSGRRSTSRRSALTPRSIPERARLPPPPCLAPARVTVACACVRPLVPTALGRSQDSTCDP